jgi:acyl-CoA thioesterase I
VRRARWSRLLVMFLPLWCAACSSRTGDPARTTETPPAATASSTVSVAPGIRADLEEVHAVTALGDSVPYGTACNCDPFPQLTGADIAQIAGHEVEVSNDAVPGARSGDVVDQVQHDPTIRTDINGSQAVLVEVGANDVAYSATCGTNASCYEPTIPEIDRNLTTIVEQIHALGHGHEQAVVLLDYWSVWLGGQYEKAKGPDYVSAADTVTARVDETIRSVAHATGSAYVDLRTAFRGPNGNWDETHLLAPDGDHPNAEGHQRIAQAIADTVGLR